MPEPTRESVFIAPRTHTEPRTQPTAAPWFQLFTDAERKAMKLFRVVIFPDRQITRRLKRHLVATPEGAEIYAASSFEEALAYIEAQELTPVGVWCGDGPYSLSPSPSIPLPPDPGQMVLFDPVASEL